MNLRRIYVISMILCMLFVAAGSPAEVSAAGFPTKTVRLIVPFAAGGSTDLMARVLVQPLSKRLGDAEIIVENRPGGSGAIATMEMLRSAPDGHTLMLASPSNAIMPPILSDVGYTNESIIAIAQATELPTNVYVKADSEIKTLEDLIKAADKDFGKMTYSTSGAQSIHDVIAKLFQHVIKKPGLLTHIPYNSGTEGLTALLGGHVDISFANASYAENYVKQQGTLKVLATSDEGGDANLPDVTSFKSLGYEVTLTSWWGVFAPVGTPKEIIELLDNAIKDSLADEETVKGFTNLGMTVNYLNHTDFSVKYLSQYDQLKEVLKDLF